MNIALALDHLGILDGDMLPASDLSDYPAMVASWRNAAVPVPSEQALIDADAIIAPMVKWQAEMAETDKDMPRWLEDHLEFAHGGVAGNAFQQAAYDNKKVKRNEKP